MSQPPRDEDGPDLTGRAEPTEPTEQTRPPEKPDERAESAPAPSSAPTSNPASAAGGGEGDGISGQLLIAQMLRSSTLVTFLAIGSAMLISALLVAVTDPDVQNAAGYVFRAPADMLNAAWSAIAETFTRLFRGAVFDYEATSWARAFRPLTETAVAATPLILAALGLGIGFRAGLFNIGAQGQVLVGAAAAAWIGFAFDLPVVVHVVVALAVGGAIGGVWAGIAGFLKARTGANEVIVTIMLNWIAFWGISFLLTTTILRPAGNRPISPVIDTATAALPRLLPEPFRLHLGFVLALLAAVAVWVLMERTTVGFTFRAVGANPAAARTAGMNVNLAFVLVMAFAGLLAGLAGAVHVTGTEGRVQASTAGSIGFDAITVALLGRSRPLGTVLAGLLFGALRAGAPLLQGADIPIDIVLVIQAIIVLFIAAPPLVRAMFRLPDPHAAPRRRKEVVA